MFKFTIADIECVTDHSGKTLQMTGVPNTGQMNMILDVLRNIRNLKLEQPSGCMTFADVPLEHFFETDAGEKFQKVDADRALHVPDPKENLTLVSFNRVRLVRYLGDNRAKLFPTAREEPSPFKGVKQRNWNELQEGTWFTDGRFIYQRIRLWANKFGLDGTLIGNDEHYTGQRMGLYDLGTNPAAAWELVRAKCKASCV